MNNIKIEKPSIYKLCITICLAMILSLFIFACGSSRDAGSGSTTTDSASNVVQDTSGAMRDTSTMQDTSSSNRIPPDSMR